MAKQSIGIKVPKIQGEKTIVLANKLQIVDRELEIQRDEDSIYVPLNRQPSEDERKAFKKQVRNCEISTYLFTERKKLEASFVDLFEDKLPPYLLASLPHSADIVGDIAIIEISSELEAYGGVIGEAFLEANKNVKTVLAKAGAVSGAYRLRRFKVIAGENKTETIHKEHGCKYDVDVSKVYFSPRLSYEHNRVASLVQENETVADLFAGVGPFAVLIAKKHENVKVYAVDVNPDAIEFLKRNIRLNRVENRVYSILGDARQVVGERLSGVADRVIMNLPEKAIEFVDTACDALKPVGGIVHFYGFINAFSSIENLRSCFTEAVKKSGRRVERIMSSKYVRATAPYEWQIVLEAIIH